MVERSSTWFNADRRADSARLSAVCSARQNKKWEDVEFLRAEKQEKFPAFALASISGMPVGFVRSQPSRVHPVQYRVRDEILSNA